MKQTAIRLLKFSMDCLPAFVKRWLHNLPMLRGWYRKNLNEHYFKSYDFDSNVRITNYRRWYLTTSTGSVSLANLNDRDNLHCCIVVSVTENRLDGLIDTLDSIPNAVKLIIHVQNEIKDQVVKVIAEQSEVMENWSFADDLQQRDIGVTSFYYAFLSAGDRLAADAIAHLQCAIEKNCSATILYSDHDYLDAGDERHLPQFKPAWNFDLQLTTNYVGHAGFWLLNSKQLHTVLSSSTSIHNQLFNWTVEQAVINASRIAHIPQVLFHLNAESQQQLANDKELTKANLLALGLSDKAISCENDCLRIEWPLPQELPLVSLIIPTKNGLKLVKNCINSILEKSDYDNFEILLVDNQSDEPASLKYFEQLSKHPKIRVIQYDAPFNYSAINNFAVEQANGEIIALVNNDIEVIDGNWLSEMVSHSLRADVGCVGAKLFYSDNTIQHAGVIIGYGGVAGHAHKHFPMYHPGYMNRLQAVQNFSAVTAACLVVKKSIYEQVGGLNEKDLTVAFNDVDFCLKVQAAGYRNVWTPYARLYHHESVSRGNDLSGEKYKRFQAEIQYMKETWNTDIRPDPAYNPNLTLKREDFSLPE